MASSVRENPDSAISSAAGVPPPDSSPGEQSPVEIVSGKIDISLWVEEHGDYLFRYTLRHFNNQEVAEDLVQECFLAAVKSANSFAGGSTVRTWLTSILRNKIIDRIRLKTREKQVSLEEIGGDDLSRFFDEREHWHSESGPREWGIRPDAALEQRQFGDILDGCMQKLPEKFKTIFVLREVDGLGREEIGETFQISANNIGVILHRARLMLRDCLQHNWLGGAK